MTPKSCIHIRQCHAACAALADQHQGLARAAGHRAAHLGEQHSQPGHRERAVMRRDGGLPDPGLPAASIRERRIGVPLGRTLFGKSVLIVGFGGIAKELVPRCAHAAARAR